MIYITGDTHADFTRFSNKRMRREGKELSEKDYVIVCGDFGLCWAKDSTFDYHCEFFTGKKFTVLWVQGNHENYDMIKEYPVEEWHGGKVRHIVRDKVILLERGQVFEIEGKTFFTFGGAASHDIQGGVLDRNNINFEHDKRKAMKSGMPFRILHESWWAEELPSEEEMREGVDNLEKCGFKVDYVITHCCSTSVQNMLDEGIIHLYQADILTDYLQMIEERLEYKHWFFGHYHMDLEVDEKHTLLYYRMIPLKGQAELLGFPVLGQPKYCHGDVLKFIWNGCEKIGKVYVVDAYGTFEQNEEPSYDFLVEEENTLYKHICESNVIGKVYRVT